MRRCGREGVWALVLDHHRITPRGWDLLGWLVKLWELDASAFIAQIPQSAQDLQLDNASLPFYTIVSALDTSVDMPKRIATLVRLRWFSLTLARQCHPRPFASIPSTVSHLLVHPTLPYPLSIPTRPIHHSPRPVVFHSTPHHHHPGRHRRGQSRQSRSSKEQDQ